jgi:hypothetical protein
LEPTPATCPTCSTVVPEGAAKCVGCGQVFGEANRCPHCNAIAAVRPASGGHACMACGKPRNAGPGVTVFRSKGAGARAKSTGKRTLGIFALAAGVFGAIAVAAAIPTAIGLVFAGVIGAVGVGVGALAMRSGASGGAASGPEENRILSLAEEKGGVLTVTDVARALGVTQAEADTLLSGMADGSRVWAEVTTDGMMRYEFRELMARRGPQVRVADELAERIEMTAEQHELAEAEREVEAMLSGRPDPD